MQTATAIRVDEFAALADCLKAATLAPSVHNSQPWRFHIRPDRIDVLLDPDRRLHTIDPYGREALISIGAAIFNLRVAILNAGRTAVTRLLPPAAAHVAASVMLGSARRPDATVRALASAIPRRRTNRQPFRDVEIREEVTDQMSAAARVEGAMLAVADDIGRESILSLTRTANDWQGSDPDYLDELSQWTAQAGAGDGVPERAFGPLDEHDALPLRDFGRSRPEMPRGLRRFEPAPTIAVLYSAGDEPIDWLRTGQALERVLLTATVRGVATTPITAPTELPALRALLTAGDDLRTAQMVLRLGYGDLCAASPRRPVSEVTTLSGAMMPA